MRMLRVAPLLIVLSVTSSCFGGGNLDFKGPGPPTAEQKGAPRNIRITPLQIYAGLNTEVDKSSDPFSWLNWFTVLYDGAPSFAEGAYSWDFGGAANPTVASGYIPEPLQFTTVPGTYQASLTITTEAGTATKPFTLTVLPLPKPDITAVSIYDLDENGQRAGVHTGPLVRYSSYRIEATLTPQTGAGSLPGPLPTIKWEFWNGATFGYTNDKYLNGTITARALGNRTGFLEVTNSAGYDRFNFSYTVVE